MSFNFIIDSFFSLWFPFVRIMAFLFFCPLLDQKVIPVRIKVILSALLSLIITPLLPTIDVIRDILSIRMIILTLEQIIWGFIFGYLFQFVFAALQMAGHILSYNMGLSMAIMNDPSQGQTTTIISRIIFIFSGILFFISNGHLLFITVLYKSFSYWSIGQAVSDISLNTIVVNLSWIISSALLLSLPTTIVMLTVQVTFGFLNRISPTLNLFSLGFPISMLFGIFCLMLLMSNIPQHYLDLMNTVLHKLDELRNHHG